jgi:DNA-binding transcriptional LysR family regulator
VPADIIATMLDHGEAGIGIAMNDQKLPLIDTEVIGASEIVCVLPAEHTLARQGPISLAQLAGETIISYRGTSLPGMLLERALAREGIRLRPDIEIDVSIIALAFVQQGLGVALVDGLIPWESFPGLIARSFVPRVELPVCLLTSTRRPLSRNHELLRLELRKAVKEYAQSAAVLGVLAPA